LIGNDIIDLNLALTSEKSRNLRFLRKVFTDDEISMIQKSEKPEILLWQFWSMKESAYKAHQRIYSLGRKLNPTSYNCTLEPDSNLGKVRIAKETYIITTEITSKYIHSYTQSADFSEKIICTKTNCDSDLLGCISSVLSLKKGSVSIQKDSNGVPSLCINKLRKHFPFSKSHHGAFTAFFIPLIMS
tara:strand:- start:201 stop:761 length:561 start_codon:yes stop_codon:yes gene_type:complete